MLNVYFIVVWSFNWPRVNHFDLTTAGLRWGFLSYWQSSPSMQIWNKNVLVAKIFMMPRMGMELNDSGYLSSWQLTHSMTTDLYLRVIRALLANLPQPVSRVLAQTLVSGVEDVQVRCDLGGPRHGVLRSPLDAAVKTRMILLKIALESLQTEIVNLLMSCKS